MSDEKRYCQVRNRSASFVCYRIPAEGIRREFAPGVTQKIPYDELEKLSYQPGGREMLTQFLQVQEEKAIQDFGIKAEPEYHMSETEIVDLLKNGSLDAFLDCLDFAPTGVIDLVKAFAVQLPLENTAKRDALKKKTGFDVEAALRLAAVEKEETSETETTSERRVKPEEPAGRRTSGDKYKIIKTAE